MHRKHVVDTLQIYDMRRSDTYIVETRAITQQTAHKLADLRLALS